MKALANYASPGRRVRHTLAMTWFIFSPDQRTYHCAKHNCLILICHF
uniref:Uncharacterized protein n=1 Tax=Anguilla anguilla TaxID=7936 RepID=A0A0E9UXL9_ANGAN